MGHLAPGGELAPQHAHVRRWRLPTQRDIHRLRRLPEAELG